MFVLNAANMVYGASGVNVPAIAAASLSTFSRMMYAVTLWLVVVTALVTPSPLVLVTVHDDPPIVKSGSTPRIAPAMSVYRLTSTARMKPAPPQARKRAAVSTVHRATATPARQTLTIAPLAVENAPDSFPDGRIIASLAAARTIASPTTGRTITA